MIMMYQRTKITSISIRNPELNKLLTDFKMMYYLEPFFLEAKTLTTASEELGIKLNTYFYWIKKFVKLGLLVVSHEENRAGSTVKYYITPSKEILIEIDKDKRFLEKYYNYYSEQYKVNKLISKTVINLVSNPELGFGILLSYKKLHAYNTNTVILKNNKIANTITFEAQKPEAPAMVAIWRELLLDQEDSKELQRKLAELIYEYDKKATPNSKRFFVQVAMAPDS